MEQLENSSPSPENGGYNATDALLRAMTQELDNLRQNLIAQLNQDLERLQSDKARLLQDINELQVERQQQVDQQQQLARQLAQGLAAQLQEHLIQRINQMAVDTSRQPENNLGGPNIPSTSNPSEYNENIYRLIGSLDSTLRTTFNNLQQDLNSYQSSFSQQLAQMHSLEQQGEAILEALVNRLAEEAQTALPPQDRVSSVRSSDESFPLVFDTHSAESNYSNDIDNGQPPLPTQVEPVSQQPTTLLPVEPPAPSAPPVATPSPKKQVSQVQLGFILVLLSTVALSVHNVLVGIIGNTSNLFGRFPVGGFIKLGLGNSLLILWMRMIVVVPLMAIAAIFLYPPVWRDISKFFKLRDRRPIFNVVGSGFFLFCSQVLIYIAIAQIGPGVAVTILFMYPILTVPLAWVFFKDRPTQLRIVVMIVVLLGVLLVSLPKIIPSGGAGAASISGLGVTTAVISGICFAFYLIFMQLGFQKLHPVPVSLVQFSTIFVLTSLSLMLPLPESVAVEVIPSKWSGLLAGTLLLGALTLAGYLLNNYGVRFLGAARASIIASSGPALTAILAVLIIPGPRSYLQFIQIIGIILVTLGVGGLSFERLVGQTKAAKAAK